MNHLSEQQKAICARHQVQYLPCGAGEKVGIALQTLGRLPLNALRHSVEGGTCGWYIWAGEEMSEAADFFQPLHVEHLESYVPELLPFLGLPPGWRVLLAGEYQDVWFDRNLIEAEA